MGATMDVAKQSQGVEVEQALGAPTMSRFHAIPASAPWRGAARWPAAATTRHVRRAAFRSGRFAHALLTTAFAPGMMKTGRAPEHAHRLPFRKIPAGLLAASGIAFCILLSEGAMADWTAVYLRQVLLTGAGTAAAGYAVFSAAMAIFRLLGDAITAHLGNVRTVRTGSLVAGVGVLCVIAAPSPLWAFPGFAAAGAGFSVIVPLAFGAGGRVKNVSPGAGVATVTGLGYIGFLFGPPTIGFIAHALTLRYARGWCSRASSQARSRAGCRSANESRLRGKDGHVAAGLKNTDLAHTVKRGALRQGGGIAAEARPNVVEIVDLDEQRGALAGAPSGANGWSLRGHAGAL